MSVVTFSGDLFCPIGVHTVGIFVRKGTPHPLAQNVLWVRALNDGLIKSKGKRLPNPRAVNDYPAITDMLRAFIGNPAMPVEGVDKLQKACPIDFSDPFLELVPENYLDQAPPTPSEVQAGIDQVTRDAAAFLIRAGREGAIRHG